MIFWKEETQPLAKTGMMCYTEEEFKKQVK